MVNAPDWVDDEVVDEVKRLTLAQEKRLLRMMEVLRDPVNLEQVLFIKSHTATGDYSYAKALYLEFTQEEQQAINIAPKFGGIFTTFERDIVKYGRIL